MKKREVKLSRKYKRPRMFSKRIEFSTNTFSTQATPTVLYGPVRDAPRREGN